MEDAHARERRDGEERYFERATPRGFFRWFRRDEFTLRRSFLHELRIAPRARSLAALEHRFENAVHHGRRVLVARTVVTALLSLGLASTVLSMLASVVVETSALVALVNRLSAIVGSVTILLVVLRLALDRYLHLVGVSADYLAMMISTAEPPSEPGVRIRV